MIEHTFLSEGFAMRNEYIPYILTEAGPRLLSTIRMSRFLLNRTAVMQKHRHASMIRPCCIARFGTAAYIPPPNALRACLQVQERRRDGAGCHRFGRERSGHHGEHFAAHRMMCSVSCLLTTGKVVARRGGRCLDAFGQHLSLVVQSSEGLSAF